MKTIQWGNKRNHLTSESHSENVAILLWPSLSCLSCLSLRWVACPQDVSTNNKRTVSEYSLWRRNLKVSVVAFFENKNSKGKLLSYLSEGRHICCSLHTVYFQRLSHVRVFWLDEGGLGRLGRAPRQVGHRGIRHARQVLFWNGKTIRETFKKGIISNFPLS